MMASPRGENKSTTSTAKAALPMDSFLEKKITVPSNNKLKIIVTTKDRSYEVEFDSNSQEIQKRLQSFLKECKKKEEKGNNLTLRRGFSALTVNSGISDDPSSAPSAADKFPGIANTRARSGSNAGLNTSSSGTSTRSLIDDKRLFGRHLETLMVVQRRTKKDAKMPLVIEQLLHYLLMKGLNEEGIFRVSPDRNALETARKQIDAGENLIPENLNGSQSSLDIILAAGLVKLFLRELPEPLLTDSLGPFFLSTASINSDEDATVKISQLVSQLPEVNRNLLQRLLCLLWNVSQNEKQNSMTVGNLSTAVGISFFHTTPGTNSIADVQMNQLANAQRVVFLMIFNYHKIFADYHDKLTSTNFGLSWSGKRLVASHKSIHNVVPIKYNLGSGTQVISTSASTIKVWDTADSTNLSKIENGNAYGHIFSVLTPRFAPPTKRTDEQTTPPAPRSIKVDPSEIWVASHRGIRIWSAATLEVKHTVESEYVNLALVKQPGMESRKEVWAVRMQGDLIHRFDLFSCQLVGSVPVPSANLFVVFATDNHVWGGTYNGCLTIWDTNGNIVKEHNQPERYHCWKITCFTQTEDYVISGGDDGLICVWDKNSLEFVRRISPNVGKLKCLSYFDSYLWVCGWEPYMKIISKDFTRMQDTETYHTDSISSVAFVFNKQRKQWQAWTGSYDGTVCVWNVPEKIMAD